MYRSDREKSLKRDLLDSLDFFKLNIMTYNLFSCFGKMYVCAFTIKKERDLKNKLYME